MGHQRAITPSSSSVKDLADLALNEADGLTLTWLAEDIGLEACAHKARSFQTTFTAFRARARRMHYREESALLLDTSAQGPYDKLACVREPLANGAGWTVSLLHAHDLLAGVHITTGKGDPVATLDPKMKRWGELFGKAQRFPHDITQEEYDFCVSVIPDCFIDDEGNPWFTLHPSQVRGEPKVDPVTAPPPASAAEMFGGTKKTP
jgi:hypothetical protein